MENSLILKKKRDSLSALNFIIKLIIISLIPCVSFAFSKGINAGLNDRMQNLIAEGKLPGINIGVWINDKLEWQGAFGFANKADKEPLSFNHYVRIGSITKTFIGVAVLQLVDKSKIKLDDPISKYVDNVPGGDEITLRHLGSMRSGLPNYSENKVMEDEYTKNPYKYWSREDLLKIAFSTKNMFKPGEDYHYSNTNTVLLGMVIEKASGLSLADYINQNILIPLKLTNTSYPLGGDLPTPYAHGYSSQTPTNQETDASLWNPSWADAAGKMISKFDDLYIWAQALGKGKLLSKETFEEMTRWHTVPKTKDKLKYGINLGNFEGLIFHTGELPGYNTLVGYSPAEEFTIVISTNTDTPVKEKDKLVPPVIKVFNEIEKLLSPEYIKDRWE